MTYNLGPVALGPAKAFANSQAAVISSAYTLVVLPLHYFIQGQG